jgi:hypothetical protein
MAEGRPREDDRSAADRAQRHPKLKAERVDSWKENGRRKEPKGLTEGILKVAIAIGAEGMGGVVGWYISHKFLEGARREFIYLAGLEAADLAAEAAFKAALIQTEHTFGAGSRAAMEKIKDNAAAALVTEGDLLDKYTEGLRLQSITEERDQATAANVHSGEINDLDLAKLVLGFQATTNALINSPQAFVREFTNGFIRLQDEVELAEEAKKYGGSVDRLRKESDLIHVGLARKTGVVGLVPTSDGDDVGDPAAPNLGFKGFDLGGARSGANNALLRPLIRTPVGDLPLTLFFHFGTQRAGLNFIGFERTPDGQIFIDERNTLSAAYQWLARYYGRDGLSDDAAAKIAPLAAAKLYRAVAGKPVSSVGT